MSLSIPPTGTQTFAVPAQKLVELRRLQQAGEMVASLELNFVREIVTFFRVRVLQVLTAASAADGELITVSLSYESRIIGAGGFFGVGNFGALQAMQLQSDQSQAQNILGQIQADSARQRNERFKIMQDMQTQIFQVQQDVTINRAKSSDKASQNWSNYIRS